MNSKGNRHPGRFAAIIATFGLFCAAPAIGLADPSDTNHGSATGIANANSNGISHSNVNGIGAEVTGTAPVPETSTYVALATLAGAAALARRRRRAARQ